MGEATKQKITQADQIEFRIGNLQIKTVRHYHGSHIRQGDFMLYSQLFLDLGHS